jgi:hypothetical protein
MPKSSLVQFDRHDFMPRPLVPSEVARATVHSSFIRGRKTAGEPMPSSTRNADMDRARARRSRPILHSVVRGSLSLRRPSQIVVVTRLGPPAPPNRRGRPPSQLFWQRGCRIASCPGDGPGATAKARIAGDLRNEGDAQDAGAHTGPRSLTGTICRRVGARVTCCSSSSIPHHCETLAQFDD